MTVNYVITIDHIKHLELELPKSEIGTSFCVSFDDIAIMLEPVDDLNINWRKNSYTP